MGNLGVNRVRSYSYYPILAKHNLIWYILRMISVAITVNLKNKLSLYKQKKERDEILALFDMGSKHLTTKANAVIYLPFVNRKKQDDKIRVSISFVNQYVTIRASSKDAEDALLVTDFVQDEFCKILFHYEKKSIRPNIGFTQLRTKLNKSQPINPELNKKYFDCYMNYSKGSSVLSFL